MSLTGMGQQFIEDSIQYIDEGSWYAFFRYLLLSKCDYSDVESILETFSSLGINFDEKARREIFETQIRNRIAFWKAKGEFQLDLNYFYGQQNNWLGYSAEDVQEYLAANQYSLNIKFKKWPNSVGGSQIIFEF